MNLQCGFDSITVNNYVKSKYIEILGEYELLKWP